jgi:hypothetical protein
MVAAFCAVFPYRVRQLAKLVGYILLCTLIVAASTAFAGYLVWKAFFYYVNNLDVNPPPSNMPTPGMAAPPTSEPGPKPGLELASPPQDG